MIEGGTIRMCAEEVGVSVPTASFMRHRILDVINLSLKDEEKEQTILVGLKSLFGEDL